MHIHFSPHLDSLDPTLPTTAIGEANVGPLGLLRMLESDLGLAPVPEHPAEQIVAYRGCLAEADNEARFYHRSFEVDPLSVARTLHDWRGRWYEAGWNGRFGADVPGRLADMAAVEAIAVGRVPLCQGQRLARVLVSLKTRRTQIETLTLGEDPEALPKMWRLLVERIGYQVAPGVAPAVHAPLGSDLEKVQSLLIDLAGSECMREKIPLAGDGSFVVVRAASRDISARAIAETIRLQNSFSDTVIIAERDGIIVDNAMERSGLPRCGFQHYSRFRSVSQVLKLCLALLWEPINPRLLLQFFIHPLGPVRLDVRRALAGAVAGEPGVGGRGWKEAIGNLELRLEEAGQSEEQIQEVRSAIGQWFESERYDPVLGAPFAALTARAQRVSNWLQGRLSMIEDPGERVMFGGAVAQCETLMTALKALADQGRSRIARIELEALVDEVAREQPDPEIFAEAGRARASIHPGNITEPWRQVIWWDLAPQRQDVNDPWSVLEMDGLRAAGVDLPLVEETLRQRSRAWLRPITNCRERLLLVVHHSDEGYHPLWSQIGTLFENLAEVDLESALLAGDAAGLPFLGVATEPLAVQPLPAPKRWWELPAEVPVPAREEESYSSLNKLFHYPHQWVLNYQARLRAGRAEDLADGPLLYGTLAHRLFEEFFNAHENWRGLHGTMISAWLDDALPRLIRQEGAVLLEPGRGVDHEQVTALLERALERLVEQLTEADIVAVRAEHREDAPYGTEGLRVRGVIDLLLTRADGQEIVVDAKWGREKARGEEIEQNLHLQLASYSYLRKTASGANQWPYQAYFIITTGNLLAPDNSIFPEARVWTPDGGVDVAGLWTRGEKTYAWRREQLDIGLIEMNGAGTEPTQRSAAPDDALDTQVEPDRFDDYLRLTGWDEFA